MPARPPGDASAGHPRLDRLDGLRGLAAAAVLLYHYAMPYPQLGWVGHGYLAVDFFFLLSGFVLCQAYEARLRAGMGWRRFLLRRVVRLYPMVVASGLLGGALALFAARRWGAEPPSPASVVLGSLLLPDFGSRTADLFPINSPMWSLFCEMLVNLLYAIVAPKLSNRILVAATVSAIAATVLLAARADTLNLGATDVTLAAGIARTVASFGLGILLCRWHRRGTMPAWSIGMAPACLILGLSFCAPGYSGGVWLWDVASAFLVYPLIVGLIVNAPPGAGRSRLSHWAGELSYPLYALHFPCRTFLLAIASLLAFPSPVTIAVQSVLAICVAGIAFVAFDRPAREWLAVRLPSSAGRRTDL